MKNNKEKKQKSTRKKENKNASKNKKLQSLNIKEFLPFTYDKEKQTFIDNENKYIMMLSVEGTNLFGFKEQDQYSYINAFSQVFNHKIGAGQIYSHQVSADVDGYIEDYQYFIDQLDLGVEQEQIKHQILVSEQRRLKYTSQTKDLVDRCFVIIFKDKDFFRLEQRCNEVRATLNPFQKTYILDWVETFQVLFNYYKPKDSNLFENMVGEVDDLMDILYPTSVHRVETGFKQCLEVDGYYYRTKYVSQYRKEPMFALMSYLATADDLDFSLHFEPASEDAITREMDKTIKSINSNLDHAKEKSVQARLEKKKSDTEEMVDQLAVDGASPYLFTVAVRIKGSSIQEVNEISHELDKVFNTQFKVYFRDGVFEPIELFNLSAPICKNDLPHYAKLTTADTLSFMYPFVFESLYDSVPLPGQNRYSYPPIYLGNTLQTNGVVFYDNFTKMDDRSNYNEFIAGTSGKGKTMLIMMLMYYRFALGYKQYVIDVEGKELNKITHYLGGENIDCSNGEKGRINPLQIRFNIPDSDDAEGKVDLSNIFPLAEHVRFLRSFLSAYKGVSDDIGLLHQNTIEKAIVAVYERTGIDFKTSAQTIVDNYANTDYPVFKDVFDVLDEQLNEEQEKAKAGDFYDKREIERLKECKAFLEPIALGADATLFNGHTNINLDSDLINFNLSAIQDNTENRVLNAQYFNVLSFVWTNIISDDSVRRKQLYADEFSVIMDPRHRDIMLYFQTIIKRIRKRYGGLTSATQQCRDVLKDSVKEEGEAIIENSVYQFYFGLGAIDIKNFDNTNLIPADEREFVQFASIGECYAKIGTATAMRIKITIDDEVFDLFERLKA